MNKQVANLTKSSQNLMILLFLGVLSLPSLGLIFQFGVGREGEENRQFTKLPQRPRSWIELGSYPAQFRQYFEDHFAFRATMVRSQALFRVSALRTSTSPEVVIGQDGWLFLIDASARLRPGPPAPLTTKQLTDLQRLLEARRDWLKKRGIRYAFLVAPDKQSIYPEYLPAIWQPGNQPSRLDQLIAHLKRHSTVTIIDPRADLLKAKSQRQLYFKTDTHWFYNSAYIAYCCLMRELQRNYPLLKPLDETKFRYVSTTVPNTDLSRMLGLQAWTRENGESVQLLKSSVMYRYGAQPTFPSVSWQNRPELPDVMFFRDSFGEAMIPFLGENFRRGEYIWQSTLDLETIEKRRPDIVIQEMVERFLTGDTQAHNFELKQLLNIKSKSLPQKALPPDYTGNHDTATCNSVTGWAMDKNAPDESIRVTMLIDGKTIETVMAKLYRPELVQAGLPSAEHGFYFEFPTKFRDGKEHTIHVTITGTNRDLGSTPKTVACGPN